MRAASSSASCRASERRAAARARRSAGRSTAAACSALWELTRGNALFLRELRALRRRARRTSPRTAGVWRWRGDLASGTRLAELVGARLRGARAAGAARRWRSSRSARPLERGLLDAGGGRGARRRSSAQRPRRAPRRRSPPARRRRAPAARRGGARAAHPTRLEAIQRRLADAVEARGRAGGARRAAASRSGGWTPAAGDGDLLRASRRAGARRPLDPRTGRALRARRGAGGRRLRRTPGARRARSPARAARSEAEHAARGARGARRPRTASAPRSPSPARATSSGGSTAPTTPTRAAPGRGGASSEDALRDELVAQRVRLAAAAGPPARGARRRRCRCSQDPGAREPARLQAAVAARGGAAVLRPHRRGGRAGRHAGCPSPRRHARVAPDAGARPARRAGDRAALRRAPRRGDRRVGARPMRSLVQRGSARRPPQSRPRALGMIWLARGRVRTALRFCREGAALLRDVDAVGMLPWALGGRRPGGGAGRASREPRAPRCTEMERDAARAPGLRGRAVAGAGLERGRGAASSPAGAALARDAAGLARARGQDTLRRARAARALPARRPARRGGGAGSPR